MTDPLGGRNGATNGATNGVEGAAGHGLPLFADISPSGPSPIGGAADAVDPAHAETILGDAPVLGLELDARYRVLAATLEPDADRHPDPDAPDRRVQLLAHPVSTFLVSVRQEGPDGRRLLEFPQEQLVDVVSAFDGARARGPLFGRAEPRPGSWGPAFSLQGRSSAPDGTGVTLTIQLAHDDLTLDLFARFDVLELKRPDGSALVA
ncbi:MAG: hypothetical protein JJT89_12035 [Nitriliruptoraceae bacterium]|nr:hypothetical protein [Nitriliruptoraceae bacterium]